MWVDDVIDVILIIFGDGPVWLVLLIVMIVVGIWVGTSHYEAKACDATTWEAMWSDPCEGDN